MRITSIELAGESKTTLGDGTPGLPRAFAKISRKPGDGHVTIELLTSADDGKHQARANDRDGMWSMARILQHTLDGYEGTNSDIDDYFRTFQMLAG